MLSKIYKQIEKVDKKRKTANKISNEADLLERGACVDFNKIIKAEHMNALCDVIENKGLDVEKKDIHSLIAKRQVENLNIEDLRKYKFLDQKYGEGLEYNKSFLDRLLENMEE